ncbi:MAG: hypothetical protein ABFS34_11095 [Gemmatimonadota bacterium]
MAATNPKVMAMIEAALKKTPSIKNVDLQAMAKKIDRAVGRLNPRQFNARYPLQIKRRAGAGGAKKAAAKPKKAATRGRPAKRAGAKSAPVRRGPRRVRRAPAASTAGSNRDAVRKVLLDYARKVAAADSKIDLVDLVMDVDRYVDRVMKAAV